MTAGWLSIEGLAPGSAIVHPVDDLIEHDVDGGDACVCGPTVEPVPRLDGSVGWLYLHHALDNRE